MAVLPAAMTLLEAAKLGDDNAFEVLLQPLLEPGYRLADQVALDRDNYLFNAQGEWLSAITTSISQSQQGTVLPTSIRFGLVSKV